MSGGPRVMHMLPPNFKAINDAFCVRGKPIIFAYGDKIFNPGKGPISDALMAHEKVHLTQQAMVGGPETWWTRYIADPEFRLEQETPAHVAEYRALMHRTDRERCLDLVASRLAGPLYGLLIDFATARRVIERGGRDPSLDTPTQPASYGSSQRTAG